MQDFVYERPTTIEAAVAALGADGAQALAGGTDLIPQLREGRRRANRVVDLKWVPELTAIADLTDGSVAVGAAANATSVARHAGMAAAYPAVAHSALLIGSVQVQNRASLGGNICNAAPSADAVPALICHQARVRIAGPMGQREEALESFIHGPGKTSLAPGELLVSIVLPQTAKRSAAKYLRFTPRREMDIAIAGAAAWVRVDAMGKIEDARIVLASVGPKPVRAVRAEQHLRGEQATDALFAAAGHLAAGDAQPISDTRGSAEYRRTLVAVLTARALKQCCAALDAAVPPS